MNFGGREFSFSTHELISSFWSIFSLLLALKLEQGELFSLAAFLVAGINWFIRKKQQNLFYDYVAVLGQYILILLASILLLSDQSNNFRFDGVVFLGLMSLGLISWKWCSSTDNGIKLLWPAIGTWVLSSVVFSYVFGSYFSPITVGLAWLLLSLFWGETRISKWFFRDVETQALNKDVMGIMGLGTLLLFYLRFFTVDFNNEAVAFSLFRIRYLSEVASIGLLFYWFIGLFIRIQAIKICLLLSKKVF